MIILGSKVRDVVSGFKGVAVARYQFLHGCTRYCVQPPIDNDGRIPDNQTFDEPQLKVTAKPTTEMKKSINETLNVKAKTGGPAPYTPSRRTL